MVATLPYTGTSNIGFKPFAVSRYTSNLVLFATIKSNASLDVKFPTHECVTTVGFCAYTHRDKRNEKKEELSSVIQTKRETKSRVASRRVPSRRVGRRSKTKKRNHQSINPNAP